MKKHFLLMAIVSIAGCQSDNSETTPPDPMAVLREKAEKITMQQSAIEATEVPQLVLKSATLTLREKQDLIFPPYNFAYNTQNSLISIASGNESFWKIAFAGDQASLIYNGLVQEFTLDNTGMGEKADVTFEGKKSEIHYLYKNGYWVSAYSTDGKLTSRIYSKEGDLLQWQIVDKNGDIKYRATYEYTDIPNNIRQEVDRWEAPHFAFRGDFLGRYSTHLLKKATINNTEILNFNYNLDEKNRVSTNTVSRTQGTFELPLAQYRYTYE